ncbi:unnamed protein product [Protopolystoma xenopodis]|uniref:Uncharacterized protein n=1 Tax=Protopolystoma xenopodis TaxID=117903 RepID=A0A448WBM7_9PLAT|nr:unnamed protein product [Protopolystoma xenopodis]
MPSKKFSSPDQRLPNSISIASFLLNDGTSKPEFRSFQYFGRSYFFTVLCMLFITFAVGRKQIHTCMLACKSRGSPLPAIAGLSRWGAAHVQLAAPLSRSSGISDADPSARISSAISSHPRLLQPKQRRANKRFKPVIQARGEFMQIVKTVPHNGRAGFSICTSDIFAERRWNEQEKVALKSDQAQGPVLSVEELLADGCNTMLPNYTSPR